MNLLRPRENETYTRYYILTQISSFSYWNTYNGLNWKIEWQNAIAQRHTLALWIWWFCLVIALSLLHCSGRALLCAPIFMDYTYDILKCTPTITQWINFYVSGKGDLVGCDISRHLMNCQNGQGGSNQHGSSGSQDTIVKSSSDVKVMYGLMAIPIRNTNIIAQCQH